MILPLARAKNEETALQVSGLKKELGYEISQGSYPSYRGTVNLLFRYSGIR